MSTMDALAAPSGSLAPYMKTKAGVELPDTTDSVATAKCQTPCLESNAVTIWKGAQSNTMTALLAPFRHSQSPSNEVINKSDILSSKPLGGGAHPSDALEYFLSSFEKISFFPAIPDPPTTNSLAQSGSDEVPCAPSEDYASLFGLKTEAATPKSLERKKYRPPKPEDFVYDTEGNALPRTSPQFSNVKRLGGPGRYLGSNSASRPVLCSDNTVRFENSAKLAARKPPVTLRMIPVSEGRSAEEATHSPEEENRRSPTPPTINNKLMRMEIAVKRRKTKTTNNSQVGGGEESFSKRAGKKSQAVQSKIDGMKPESRSYSLLKSRGMRENKASHSDRSPRRSISPLKVRWNREKKTGDDGETKSGRSWSPLKGRREREKNAESGTKFLSLRSIGTKAKSSPPLFSNKASSTLTVINEKKSTSSGTTRRRSRSSKSFSSSSEVAEGLPTMSISKKSASPLLLNERAVREVDYSKTGGEKSASTLTRINERKVSSSTGYHKNKAGTLYTGSAESRRSQRSLFTAQSASRLHESTKTFMSPSAKGRLLIEI